MDPEFAKHDSFYSPGEWNAQSWIRYGGESKSLLMDWTALLELGDQVSPRKLRLFLCACCRHVWPQLDQEAHQCAVEIGEQFADGHVTDEVRRAAYERADRTIGAEHFSCLACVAEQLPVKTVRDYAKAVGPQYVIGSFGKDAAIKRPNQLHHALLLRDVFGDAFRPVTFSPEWLTSTAVSLASQMYDSRDFSAMPILADALQDAGCENEAILNHCRSEGVHVRGCWVIDLLTGRK
jgi:hypothetical protein